jgi:4-amino-4-deoxy-L-arabinose transferase-like glycosyltransferase
MSRLKNYDLLCIVYLIIYSLIIIPLLGIPSIMSDDGTHMLLSLFYRDLTTTILKNRDFSFSKAYNFSFSYLVHYPKLQVFYPPLYHLVTGLLFYSILGISSFAARFSNFIFGILSITVLYIFSSRFTDKRSAFISVLIFSLNPTTLSYIRLTMKDFATIFFSLLCMLIFFMAKKNKKSRYFFVSGVLASLAVLSDRSGLVLLPTVFAIFLLEREKLKNILIFFLSSSILLIPYSLIVLKVGGLGLNLLIYQGYGFLSETPWERLLLLSPVFGILFVSLTIYVKKKKQMWKEFLVWFFVGFIMIFFMVFKPRFIQFFLLPAYTVAGFWLSKKKTILIIILIYSLVVSFYLIKTYLFPTYPVQEVVEYVYSNLPDKANIALLTERGDTLYSSSFMFPVASLDENKTIMFLRPCYFWNKTGEETIGILKESGVYFVIGVKETPEYDNLIQIKDELEKVLEKDTIEVYRFKDYKPTDNNCNYICTTGEILCTKFTSPFNVYS